jgi:hypothetical protein
MTTIMGIAQPIIIDLGEDEERGEWVVVAAGWGVTESLQLDWMDDGIDGWMEKASRPRRPLYIRIVIECPQLTSATSSENLL